MPSARELDAFSRAVAKVEQMTDEERAYEDYKDAARKLADATSAMKAAQLRFSAALQKLTAIVAPIEEAK